MRIVSIAAILLLAFPVYSQIPDSVPVGNTFTAAEISGAQEVLESIKTEKMQWALNTFQIIVRGTKAKGVLTCESTDESIISIKEIPAGAATCIGGVRAGTKDFQWLDIPGQKDSYFVFRAVKPGTTRILILAVVDNKAVVISRMMITVGDAPPDDPPKPPGPLPSNDHLVMAARSDMADKKGVGEDLDNYAVIFSMYASQVRNGSDGDKITTTGDLFREMNASIDKLLGADIDKVFPQLRRAVGRELSSRIPIDASTKLSTCRPVVSSVLSDISKRLTGVR